ncbi:hypothetical protein [Akkermansia muciniphila]|uniref:ADP-ribosyltransferase-containing protein n=2 Tax=Akkermansia TaxID=239934 RepID=UPI0027D1F185|nr:hypothetical protein [Akkermansia muciniphila]WMB15123.1 hypothetical protein O4G22_10615 [Akkermansia muciniphila]WMB19693.1 hypothetical protein O4G19_11305 [Akkermansia muciniphila]
MFGNDISQVAAQAKEFERSGKRDKFAEESANAVYDDGEGRQLFPVEIDPAMDRYLRQKGEGWQADAWNSYQRGKMLAADLRKGGDDPLRAEKMRVLGEERERLKNYFVARKRRGLPFFTDVLRFQAGVNEDAAAERRKDKEVWHRSVFCGDLKKIPEGLKKRFAERKLPDGEIGDEMRYRSIVFGWALNEGGYAKWQVEAGNGVPVLEQMCIRLKEQGEQVDFNKPGQTVYMFLSRQAQKDAQADELLKGAAESVRQAVLTGGDGRQALWEQRGQMGEDMYKKVGNTLRWVKADAERTRRGLEPVLPRVMEGLEWAVKYADGTANRIFQPEGMASIHQALKAMDGLTDAQMDALAEIVQRKGGNERSYMANVWKAGNRGWEDLGNGIRSLLRGGIAAQLDVAGGVKELFGGDGSALKADAKAADEYGRRLDAFLAMAQGTYRPINKPEYGWFGNGVLSAVRSVPITALSFSGVGAGVAAMSYAGDSYSKAVQERPDGGRLARLGGAAASGAVQGALDRAGAIVAKGVMGLRSGSAFVDKWMSKLSLSRQAMRLKSSALRAGARSGVAGGMVLGEEMTTEKLQDLADPVMQSLASVMAGEAPGIDWERFWKDFTNRDQNMELFGSVLAFALVGAGARFTAEAGMQRQLSREYGKLKRTFGFSDSLLARMRAEESDVARYAMMQDGIQDFMRQNYGKEVDGVKVGLGDADGMRKLAARGGVRTMDVVAAAEAHAAETARGVDEVRVDGAEVQEGKGAVVGVKGPESGGVSEVGSGPVLSFEHGPVPERKGGRQVDEKEAMKQYVEAVNEQLREFVASPIREKMNEFTEEMQYVVELGDRPEFYDTYDDAYEAVLRHLEEREDEVVAGLKSSLRQYRDKDEGYVGRVQDEANEEMMQHLSDVGQDGRMSFDRSKLSVPMTLAQLKTQGDFMRKSAEGRERIYAAQMGVEAGVDAARLRVYGANVAQEFANGRYEVVSRLYRGANPFDVYEEWTEGMTKVLIKDNEWTVAEFEDELKRLEGATGETFLATGEGVDRLQAVCEGVSKAARAHLMGHISDERLPDKLRRWFKMFALLFAKYFEFAQDVMLAKKMLGADVQGKMSEKFRRLLNDFAGFDEAAIAERARREEQAQIEAEAMGDVPEIGEWVAGRLPHPKTAAEAGSDLTGELQRIYDALTTTRTAKGRRRKDGTLGKSFEQRVVARAEQFFSREGRVSDVLEAANEAGFDFADSGELLSAVYDSVVYGYKRYAARGEGQEVSFSMGDRVRRVPMAEARRVADAFHRVEGMEPVAADVPAAYASDLKDALGDIRERYRVLQKETQEQGYALVMGDGKRVQVGGKGWREVKQHAADRRVLAALAVLPELAGRAEFIYSGENSDLKRKPNIARFHYYLTKADFKGASDDGSADLAYVNIAVAEGKNGELFYDLDASTVEDVDSMKGTSATLQRPRVPNTGEAGDGVPHKGRVALLKEFVNYVDRDLAGQNEADVTFSASDQRGRIVEAAKEAGTFSLSLEKEAIKKEAVAADTFMKAPNGKDTNLTEDQWLSVRTAAFKNWFGDWEKDPQNASKVVDENGEPRVVYHGTYGDFTVFDKAMIGSATDYGIWGRGFYFTNMENTPYGNKKLALFLNIRNPFIFNDYKSAEEIGDYLNIWDGNFHEDDRFGIFRPYAAGAAQIADSAQERGHDGLMVVLGKWTEYIAFEPNQIKSATDNRGTFDPKNPDITFSVRAVQNLGAVHSISPEKLMEAEKLGGMPVPSVAVTRLDQPYSWGGDNSIYLIGRPGMIDPKGGADVYSRDAWTGKMPYLVHKAVGRESREQTVADLFKMEDVYQSREDSSWLHGLRYYIALDSAGDKTSREDVERCLRDEDGKALFAWQSGYRPRPKMRNAAMKHEWMTRALRDELAAYETLSEEEYESRAGEVRQKAEAAIDEYVGGLHAELEKRKPKIVTKMRENRRKTLLNSLFLSDKQGLREVLQDARRMGKRVPDLNANSKMLARYADNHKRAYEKWVQEKLAGWFSEERYIEGTGTEATLESLTKWMLSRKGRNREQQLVFGSGKVRAAQAERLGSMDEVKAMRERLSDSAVSGTSKKMTDELLREFREVVSDVFTGGDVFGYSSSVEIQSAAMEALSKVPGNPTTGKVMTALKKVFPRGARLNKLLMREDVLEKGVDALKSLRAELEDYLEAVPQRAVGLDEWVYAVMPEELKKNREVTSLLRRHGIKPLYHDGTAEGRVRVMESLVDDPVVSFAMRMMRGGQSVWDYLAGVQGHAFEQEARLYEAMQKRLESALQANGFTRDGVYKDEQGRDDEAVRERMLAVMAVCDAVVTELPRDVRGGIRPEVVASYREEVMAKKTWRGRMNALMRMVKYVDWHIVNEGKKSRFKEFERFRKWAAASVGENRVRRGKMNAEIQKRLDMVERVLELDADELETAKNTAEQVVEEKALIGGAEYDEAVEWVRALDAFGGLYERNMHGRLTADLERVQAALDALKEMYAAGRLANEAFWEDRRERIADLLDEAGKGLGREQPVSVNERTGAAKHDVGVGKGMRNLVRGFVSFENLMEDLFGEGKVTEYFAEGIRKARLEFNDVRQRRVLRYYGALYRIARPEEFLKRADRKVDGQVKLGVRRVVDGMLKDLSENRTWGIEVKMPGEFRSERVRIEEARAVAEGKMEAEQMPKWAKNQKAMDALKMALSEIPAKSRKEFVKFSWLEQGAELVEMEMSDLEAAYLLQMSAMPEYEDNLEALGFDEAAIGKVRDHIDVRALRVAEYLGEEYERGYKEYNEVYRRLFGCDMPKVQNYAPGFFVTDNAAEAVDPMESRGSGWLSVGSIKMRRKHYALPRVVSCVNAYWAHSMQMDHWASFAEIMRDMKAVLLNGELGNKIDAVHGAQARTHLTKWVKDLEFDGSQDSGGAGQAQQVVSRVLGAMAQGALSYNLKTCLKQLPAMFSSMADMSPSDAMKGFIGALANPGQLAEVWMSPTIQQRLMQGVSPEMRQALTANRMKVSMLGDAVEAGMLPIGLTDAAFTTFSGGIAYMAAKKKAMKEGLSNEVVEQRALAALDKAVRRTAQPIETEQKSPWEIHANALGRMFMMFRSDPRKQIALSYMAIAKWKRGEIGVGEAAWRFGQAWVVYGIMNQVIVEFLKWVMGQGDDEEELDLWDRWKGFAVSGAMGAFSGIFGLAEVIEFIYSKLAGEKYMKFSNTMVDHAEALWRGGEGVVRMYNGEEEEYGKVMNQLGRGLNGMGLFAAAGRPEIGAAVQVMGRIVKETKSMAGTWGHLWDNEMAKAREQQRLIQATKKEEKEERKAKMEERKELMARVKGLDYSSRMKVYQDVGLDKEERKLMENRVKMDGASEVVKAVSRVKKDKRKELVEKLKGTMSDVEYEEFVTEMKEKGVKWK